MSHRKTHDQYVAELSAKGFNIQPLSPYSKARTKLEHRCLDCDYHWSAAPNTILTMYTTGCPSCAIKNRSEGHVTFKTSDEYVRALAKHRSDVILAGTYVANYTKAEHKCLNCDNRYDTLPSVLLCNPSTSSNKCPHCPHLRPRVIKAVRRVTIEGVEFKVQGYEDRAIESLLRDGYQARDILAQWGRKATIPYELDGVNRKHYPDIGVNGTNILIEVKSSYTLFQSESEFRKVQAKARAALRLGYDYRLYVYCYHKGPHAKLRCALPSDWHSIHYADLCDKFNIHTGKGRSFVDRKLPIISPEKFML
jgi:Zn finger protein HypA/HybF involved in hydrogenase expression